MPLGHKRLFTCLQHRFCASHTSLMTLCFWLSLFIQYHGVNSVGGPLPPLNPSTAAASNARRIIDATSASFERVFHRPAEHLPLTERTREPVLARFFSAVQYAWEKLFQSSKGTRSGGRTGKAWLKYSLWKHSNVGCP